MTTRNKKKAVTSLVFFLCFSFSVFSQETAWVQLTNHANQIAQHKAIYIDNSYVHTYQSQLGIWLKVKNNKELEKFTKVYASSLQHVKKINQVFPIKSYGRGRYLFFPFSSQYLTELQDAGIERIVEESREGEFIWPIVGVRITSRLGRRWGRYHSGLDIAASIGTPVVAALNGKVTSNSTRRGYGITIELAHDKKFITRYAHLDVALVKVGDVVEKGQLIGYSGNTGRSTGPHLHFEVQSNGIVLDPEKFLPAFEKSMESAWRFNSFLEEKVH